MVFVPDSSPDPTPTTEPLAVAALETERHVAASGWDQNPRVFALVDTAALAAAEPQLAASLTGDADRAPGAALARVVGDVGLVQDLTVRVRPPLLVAAVVPAATVAALALVDVASAAAVGAVLAATAASHDYQSLLAITSALVGVSRDRVQALLGLR